MGYFTAQPAPHTALIDMGDRLRAQRVGIGFYGERGAARKPDAGMIAGANILIDAESVLRPTIEFLSDD